MVTNEIIASSISDFAEILSQKNVQTVILALVDEKRSVETGPDSLEVLHVNSGTFLGYLSGVIIKYTAANDEIDTARKILETAGIYIAERDRNIT